MLMEVLSIIGFTILGMALGSFFNVCIDRLPREESILNPPSHCEACHHRLGPKDLIPIFSYLWLRGRCRYCHQPIPRRLFLVELVTAAIFPLLYLSYGLTSEFVILAFYVCLFLIVFVIDMERGLILNRVVYPGMALALLIAGVAPQQWLLEWGQPGIIASLAGGGVGFAIFLLIAIISRGGMGWGDVKLCALIGLAVGFPLVFIALLIGIVLGGVVALALLVSKRRGRRETIPFGPFLSLGAVITLIWWGELLACFL
jgi:leader peptidase (prepilin peptidase)/N-methyltransferase